MREVRVLEGCLWQNVADIPLFEQEESLLVLAYRIDLIHGRSELANLLRIFRSLSTPPQASSESTSL